MESSAGPATLHGAGNAAQVGPARPEDRDAIGAVAFATAFFGEPAPPFFPDVALFTQLWVAPYLDAGWAWIARHEGRVVGYCIGADRPEPLRRAAVARLPRVVVDTVRGRYPGWGAALRLAWRAVRYPPPRAPTRRYPAHLHLNVLSEARGSGIGRRLLRACLDDVRQRGVPGIQLSTTVRNRAALGLYAAFGFTVFERRRSGYWRPWTGADLVHVVMTLDLTAPRAPDDGISAGPARPAD